MKTSTKLRVRLFDTSINIDLLKFVHGCWKEQAYEVIGALFDAERFEEIDEVFSCHLDLPDKSQVRGLITLFSTNRMTKNIFGQLLRFCAAYDDAKLFEQLFGVNDAHYWMFKIKSDWISDDIIKRFPFDADKFKDAYVRLSEETSSGQYHYTWSENSTYRDYMFSTKDLKHWDKLVFVDKTRALALSQHIRVNNVKYLTCAAVMANPHLPDKYYKVVEKSHYCRRLLLLNDRNVEQKCAHHVHELEQYWHVIKHDAALNLDACPTHVINNLFKHFKPIKMTNMSERVKLLYVDIIEHFSDQYFNYMIPDNAIDIVCPEDTTFSEGSCKLYELLIACCNITLDVYHKHFSHEAQTRYETLFLASNRTTDEVKQYIKTNKQLCVI